MAMTRRQLKEIGLPQEQIEQVIALHAETVEALRREGEEKLTQSAAERAAMEEELRQAKDRCAALNRQALERLVREALLLRGADPRAVPLLMKAVALDGVKPEPDDDGPVDLHAVIAPVEAEYGAFFCREVREGLPVLNPPGMDGSGCTREDVRNMEQEEINRSWVMVREALAGSPDPYGTR